MLTNKELEAISQTIDLLNTIEENMSYYIGNELNITDNELLDSIKKLHDIYSIQKMKKSIASYKTNNWNKTHPEKHREHNKKYAENKKLKQEVK